MAELPKVVRIGDTLTNLIDKNTNQTITYTKVNNWWDGTPMTADKADGEIYRRKGVEYFLKNLGKYGELFLEKDTMQEMRDLNSTEILLIQMGYYKGVKLNGYYQEGDTPKPIHYLIEETAEPENTGSIIELTPEVKLVHNFIGNVDLRYFGGFDNIDITDALKVLENTPEVEGVIFPKNTTLLISERVDFSTLSFIGNLGARLRVVTTNITPLWFTNYKDNTIKNLIFDSNNSPEMFNTTFMMLTGNSENNVVENITFENISVYSSDPESLFIPSSPPLYLIAKDEEDDYSLGDVGYVKNNTFKNIKFRQVEGYSSAFVIRVVTNWIKQKVHEDVVNKCEFNTFDHINITGDYLWNMVEFAGTGTVQNTIKNSYFKGRSITAIDFDKGASYNIADNNYVELSLSSYHEYAESAFIFAPINNHGGNGLTNFGNVITKNKLYNCGDLHENQTPLEACIGFQFVEGGLCSENRITDTKNAVCGIHFLGEVVGVDISNNIVKRIISRAITVNANQGGNHNNNIINNILESENNPLLLAGNTASNNNNNISGNTITCTNTSNGGIFATAQWTNLKIVDNYIYNTGDKIVSSAPNTLIKGNTLDGSSNYSIRTTGSGNISDNVNLTYTLGLVGSAASTIRQWNNSWNSVPNAEQSFYRSDGVAWGNDASVVPTGFWTSTKSITISSIGSSTGFPTSEGLLVTYQNGGGATAGNYARSFDIFKSYNNEGLYYRRYSSSGAPQIFVRLDNVTASPTTKGVVNQMLNITSVTTPDAVDEATAIALSNSNKAKINEVLLEMIDKGIMVG